MIFDQQLRLVFGAKLAVPARELDVGAWKALFDINLPSPDFDEAAGVGHSLTISLPKGLLEIGRFNPPAAGVSENRRRRILPVVTAVMRPVRQAVVIADQVTMKFDRLLDRFAPFPVGTLQVELEFRIDSLSNFASDALCRTCGDECQAAD